METELLTFHSEDEKFSATSLLYQGEEVSSHLYNLEDISHKDFIIKKEENPWYETQVMTKGCKGTEESALWDDGTSPKTEDFQQMLTEWHQHIGSFQVTDSDDVSLDVGLDAMSINYGTNYLCDYNQPGTRTASQSTLFSSKSSNVLGTSKLVTESKPNNLELSLKRSQVKTSSNLKTQGKNIILTHEKEIFGKSIIGLHSLNEIEENPQGNCRIASVTVEGRKYKVIIRPKKTQDINKLSEETLQKQIEKWKKQFFLNKSNERDITLNKVKAEVDVDVLKPVKLEPKDEMISELQNGNYSVPETFLDSPNDLLLQNWNFNCDDINLEDEKCEEVVETKSVPPLTIKLVNNDKKRKKVKQESLLKKNNNKKVEKKEEEEIDVETVPNEKNSVLEAGDLKTLLEQFEAHETGKDKKLTEKCWKVHDDIKNGLPKEMVERMEASRKSREGRIPLIQAMPSKKAVRSGTRMQEAAAAMNRNKLLKIVTGSETVQLDHDYCTNISRNSNNTILSEYSVSSPLSPKNGSTDENWSEKNSKKDSGLESGDVSDASEEPHTPESLDNLKVTHQLNTKLLEERRRAKNHQSLTKVAAAFFRATNANCSKLKKDKHITDEVKTLNVSNGNKVLTNSATETKNVVSNVPVTSESAECDLRLQSDNNSVDVADERMVVEAPPTSLIPERPKKKLKLEEYLSRRHEKEKQLNSCESSRANSPITVAEQVVLEDKKDEKEVIVDKEIREVKKVKAAEEKNHEKDTVEEVVAKKEKTEDGSPVESTNKEKTSEKMEKARKRQYRSRCSTSSSRSRSTERGSKGRIRRSRDRRSRSRDRKWDRRRGSKTRSRSRRSPSVDKGRSFWSRSRSRSSSRESSSSSDRSGNRRRRSPIRRSRRSRSRSKTRSRSRSRTRGYSYRRRYSNYYNRNCNNRRSRSPYQYRTENLSLREKQRQIEERRVIYVGRIDEGMTNGKLRERFGVFGPIVDISVHFREHGDNYGFVTYAYKSDAYDAVEHGNDDPDLPKYDLCFGGRRGFCKQRYSDLDGMPTSYSAFNDAPVVRNEDSFDILLKEVQAKLKKRKT